MWQEERRCRLRLCKPHYRSRDGRKRQTARWYVEFTDHLDIVRRERAFEDKRASEAFGRRLEQLVAVRVSGDQPDAAMARWLESLPSKARRRLGTIGLLDAERVAAHQPLRDHLGDYERALVDKDNTAKHAAMSCQRVRSILDNIKAVYLSDLRADAVMHTLAERRTAGMSAASSNHYLTAIKGFCRWLVKAQRATTNPLAHLSRINARADRRRVRRPLTPDELRLLLVTTCGGGAGGSA